MSSEEEIKKLNAQIDELQKELRKTNQMAQKVHEMDLDPNVPWSKAARKNAAKTTKGCLIVAFAFLLGMCSVMLKKGNGELSTSLPKGNSKSMSLR